MPTSQAPLWMFFISTLGGTIVGGAITIFGNYWLDCRRLKQEKKDEELKDLIELKKALMNMQSGMYSISIKDTIDCRAAREGVIKFENALWLYTHRLKSEDFKKGRDTVGEHKDCLSSLEKLNINMKPQETEQITQKMFETDLTASFFHSVLDELIEKYK